MTETDSSRTPEMIQVLIVDDHPLFRDGLIHAFNALAEDIAVAGHVVSGELALTAVSELNPQVVLLDVNLPGMNGMQVAKQMKSKHSNVSIVMLTAHHDTEQVLHAMRSGASAYCAKDIAPDELIDVIRQAAAGHYVVDGEVMNQRSVANWIQTNVEAIVGPHSVAPDEHIIPLNPRETEILQSVTNGLSNKEIANKLGISQQTVKNHMTSILRKLNVEDRTQAAVTALRRGWVRIDSD